MDASGECHLLFVPVRGSGSGAVALRTARLPSGQRVGLAYTSAAALLSALGPGQPWIRLHEDAMHDMLGSAGIEQIRVDACLWTPPPAAGPQRAQSADAPRPPASPHPGLRDVGFPGAAAPDRAVPLRVARPCPRPAPPGPGPRAARRLTLGRKNNVSHAETAVLMPAGTAQVRVT